MLRPSLRPILAGVMALLITCAGSCRRSEGRFVPKGVQYLGKITEPAIRESSGVAASHRYLDVFWTHNDSGNPNVLYAITRHGSLIGKWCVLGPRFVDWEDITLDPQGDLLLADTGDNGLRREYVRVHRVKEPDPLERKGTVAIEQTWVLSYPKGRRNTEAIIALGTNCYLITKRINESAEVYHSSLSTNNEPIMLELLTEIDVGSPVSSAALSPNLKLLAVMSSAGAFAYRIDGDISHLCGLAPCHLTKFDNRKIEGCTFVPEGLLATSERRYVYLFTDEIFHGK